MFSYYNCFCFDIRFVNCFSFTRVNFLIDAKDHVSTEITHYKHYKFIFLEYELQLYIYLLAGSVLSGKVHIWKKYIHMAEVYPYMEEVYPYGRSISIYGRSISIYGISISIYGRSISIYGREGQEERSGKVRKKGVRGGQEERCIFRNTKKEFYILLIYKLDFV